MYVPKDLAHTWEARLVRFLGIPIWAAGLLSAFVVAATYFLPGWAFGFLPVDLDLEQTGLPIDPYSWAAIVTSLLAGFTVFALPYVQTRHQVDITSLAPAIPSMDHAQLRRLYTSQAGGALQGRIVASLIGWCAGLLIPIFSVPGALPLIGGPADSRVDVQTPAINAAAGWFLVVVPVLIASLAKASYLMITVARRVLGEVEQRIEVGPLDADRLRPLANAGLHTAFVWMVGASIGLLFVLDANIDAAIILTFMAFIGLLGGLAAVNPTMVGARILRKAKAKALSEVRAALSRLHLHLLDSSNALGAQLQDDPRLPQLGALLAYESRLEDAATTPLNAPVIARFMLYLAIPVGSWLGGAFVERLVDAALG